MSLRAARASIVVSMATLVTLVGIAVTRPDPPPRADLVHVTVAPGDTAERVSRATTTTALSTAPGPPVRIRIPSLGVDATVVPVGLEPDGSMQVPGPDEVGWYEPGPRPGAPQGSAVLAAHVDYGGRPGAFFDLRSLAEGAEVFVAGEGGAEHRFVVSARSQVDKDLLPVEELFRSSGPPTLTLITCGGAFDRATRHYDDNIVIRARPQS